MMHMLYILWATATATGRMREIISTLIMVKVLYITADTIPKDITLPILGLILVEIIRSEVDFSVIVQQLPCTNENIKWTLDRKSVV